MAKQKLYDKLKSMLNHLGMHPNHLIPRNLYMKNEIGIGGVAHQAGTCRFGTDPKSSVLDVNCKAHELDNLYVVDTSFFPSIGAVNPFDRNGQRFAGRRLSAATPQMRGRSGFPVKQELGILHRGGASFD